MEDIHTSTPPTKIHNVPVVQPVHKLPFGRTWAVTIDGRQWSRHYRDRNKIYGGWVEFHPEEARMPPASLTKPTSNSTSSAFNVEGCSDPALNGGTGTPNKACELCKLTHYYGNEDVDGEMQLQLVTLVPDKGTRKDWAFFVGRESGRGELFHVTPYNREQMRYNADPTDNLFGDLRYCISSIRTMARNLTPQQVLLIKSITSAIRPPSIRDGRIKIIDTSQTWCVDVMYELVRLGIGDKEDAIKLDYYYRDLLPGEVRGDMRFAAKAGGGWTLITKDGWAEVEG